MFQTIRRPGRRAFAFLLLACALTSGAVAKDYDPLRVTAAKAAAPASLELSLRDRSRERDIPVRVFLPPKRAAAPVVLFSHGLGGSRAGNTFLGQHWSARGYLVVFLQHPGSDAEILKDQSGDARMASLRAAANARNFVARVKDVHAVLDQLERWNEARGHPLAGRMDLQRIGMSGHSFGALTAQAVGGQSFPLGDGFIDARVKAAVLFSPNAPRRGEAEAAFSKVRIPWMLMTGTRDGSPVRETSVETRLLVFPALPRGGKYEVVFDRAEHSAFTDRALPGDEGPRNPNHHRAILALSTAFWDAYLLEREGAKAWLDGEGAEKVLEKEDRWKKK